MIQVNVGVDGIDGDIQVVDVSSFREPVTRMVLSGDGSTTLMLQALVSGPLTIRVLNQSVVKAGQVPARAREALRLADGHLVVSRCSALVNAKLRPVSLNHVVAPFAPGTQLGGIVTGAAAGIGAELKRQRVDHRRELIACGVSRWPAGRPAAVKVYRICRGEEPEMWLREMFHPGVVPPDTCLVAAARDAGNAGAVRAGVQPGP